MATKKATSKRASVKSRRASSKPNNQFITFRFTHETIYWIILTLLVLAIGLWVLTLTARVQSIYDQIDLNSTTVNPTVHLKK